MPRRGAFLRAEDFGSGKDTLKYAGHYLFIQLRAGGERSFLIVKIINAKNSRAALGVAASQNWRLKFGKLFARQSFAEGLNDCFLHLKNIPPAFTAQSNRQIIQMYI